MAHNVTLSFSYAEMLFFSFLLINLAGGSEWRKKKVSHIIYTKTFILRYKVTTHKILKYTYNKNSYKRQVRHLEGLLWFDVIENN